MARRFTSASNHRITLGAGAFAGAALSDWSLAAILRPATTSGFAQYPVVFVNGSNTNGIRLGSGSFGLTLDSDASRGPTTTISYAAGEWVLLIINKAAAGATFFHKYSYSSGLWARGSNSLASNPTGTVSSLRLGSGASSNYFNGDIAVAAWFNKSLSNADTEALPFSLAAWVNLRPRALAVLDQQATTQTVKDWMGNGSNQTAITGTSVSTESVPILSYGHPVILTGRASAAAPTTMARLWHSFEADEASGTAVSAANSTVGGTAFTSVTVGSGASLIYDSAALRGSLSLRYTTGGTAAQSFATWSGTQWGASASRVYGRATVAPTALGGQTSVIRVRGGGSQLFRITISSGGTIELRNSANTAVASAATAMTVGASVWRIAWDVTIGASATGVVNIYHDPTSDTPSETLTAASADFGTTPADEANVGCVSNISNVDVRVDDVMVTDQGLPGPPEQSRGVAEAATVGDAVTRGALGMAGLQVAETVTAGDTVARVSGVSRSVGEAVTAGDATGRVSALSRVVAETVAAGDTAARVSAAGRAVTETVAAGDSVTRAGLGAPRAVAETLAVADSAARAGHGMARPVAETVTAGDVASRNAAGSAAASAAVTVADQAQRVTGLPRAVTESVTAGDTAGRGVLAGARQVAETVPVNDTAATVSARTRQVSESVSVADATVRALWSGSHQVAEAVNLSDQVSRTGAGFGSITETVGVADTVGRSGLTQVRQVAESAAVTDGATRQVSRGRAVAESVTVADEVSRSSTGGSSATVSVSLADAMSRGPAGTARAGAETVTVADSALFGPIALSRLVAESVTLIAHVTPPYRRRPGRLTAGASRRSLVAGTRGRARHSR